MMAEDVHEYHYSVTNMKLRAVGHPAWAWRYVATHNSVTAFGVLTTS